MQSPEEVLEGLYSKGILRREDDEENLNDPVKQSIEELKRIILNGEARKQDARFSAWTEEIDFDRLSHLSFVQAREVIKHISLGRRIFLLKVLDHHRIHLYDAVKAYTDQGFGRSMSPKEFQRIMGRIKHLEVLALWLYGIE